MSLAIPQEAEAEVLSSVYDKKFFELQSFLEHEFYQPDLEAFRIALATVISHYFLETDPVWLFIVGSSGSAKTALAITALSALPNTHVISDLTSSTFLSGYGSGKKGLLHYIGKHGILLWKDFTTLLSKKQETRDEIIAQLREIHDGRMVKFTGSSDMLDWAGKVTCIAATTQTVERAWAMHREMGERWVQVRWRSGDPVLTAEAAHRQAGHKRAIAEKIIQLTREFVDHGTLNQAALLSQSVINVSSSGLSNLARLVSILRCTVVREKYGKDIIDIPYPETPTRLMTAMAQVAKCHAILFRRKVNTDDLKLSRRLALDTIPINRLKIFQSIPDGADISQADLVRLSGLPQPTVHYLSEELEALKVMEQSTVKQLETRIRFTDEFAELKQKAGFEIY